MFYLEEIIDKKIAVNCTTLEMATTLVGKAFERGLINGEDMIYIESIWNIFRKDFCIIFKNNYYDINTKECFGDFNYQIIHFNDIDFNDVCEKEETRKRRRERTEFTTNLFTTDLLDKKTIEEIFYKFDIDNFNHIFKKIPTNITIFYDNFFTINRKKKTLFLQYKDKKTTIKCHENDKFNWKIGLGLALSQVGAIDSKRAYFLRDIMRNSKTHKLDYKKYSNFVLNEYFKYDKNEIKEYEEIVNETEDNVRIFLKY